jgi:indole-3-glycerol phosphate synthase
MKDILKEICDNKLLEIEQAKKFLPLAFVRGLAEKKADKTRGFINSLKSKQPAIIAEVKKKSPSKGIIRENFNHVEIAKAYESAGAACISVLTDNKYFDGKNEYLTEIRRNVSLPLIRKDFMLDAYQIYESRAIGADCILLIIAALEKNQALELETLAHSLGLDVLIEVHDEAELEVALQMKSNLIGVNNRNLKTMEISLETGKRLAKLMPDGIIKVCESGIYNNAEIREMQAAGFNAFLVGESLMKQENIEKALKELIG